MTTTTKLANMFVQTNITKNSKGSDTCNVVAVDVHGERMAIRKFEIFAAAPVLAKFDELFTATEFCGAYAVYKGDTDTAAVLSIDDDGKLRNNSAALLMNKANTLKSVKENIIDAAKAWHCNKATRKAASIMNDPDALELVKQLLAEQAAAEKKAAAAAKRAAKKAQA